MAAFGRKADTRNDELLRDRGGNERSDSQTCRLDFGRVTDSLVCLHGVYMTNQRPRTGRQLVDFMVPAPRVELGTY